MEYEHQIDNKEDIDKIMQGVDLALGEVRKDIQKNLEIDKQFINRLVISTSFLEPCDVECINNLYEKQKTEKWPVTIWETKDQKGFRTEKDWIHDLMNAGMHPIVDHTKSLKNLFSDIGLEDRAVITQPYPYSKDDEDKLKQFCADHHLKYIKKEHSPYYPGCGLIIIFEEDVEHALIRALNIDKLSDC